MQGQSSLELLRIIFKMMVIGNGRTSGKNDHCALILQATAFVHLNADLALLAVSAVAHVHNHLIGRSGNPLSWVRTHPKC